MGSRYRITSKNKLFVIILLFIMLQIPMFFSLSPSDENIYFYMGKVISEGKRPYIDFFYSHPPFQIYLYALFFKLGIGYLPILKLLTCAFNIGTAIFLYLYAEKRYNKKIAFISVFLFLTSYQIFVFGSFAMGLEIALFFFMVSLYFNDKNSFISGFFYGLSVISRLHFALLGLVLLLNSRKKWKFLLGSSIILLHYGPLLLIPNFYSNVFGYHISKLRLTNAWLDFFKNNGILLMFFMLSLRWIKDNIILCFIILQVFFYSLMSTTFEYYFIIVVALFCIESANAVWHNLDKKWIYAIFGCWMLIIMCKAGYFAFPQTNSYGFMADYVISFDKDIIGEAAVTSLMALKTGKNISKLQIDTNFQRINASYDYSDSIVIYEQGEFNAKKHNCSLYNKARISSKIYEFWDC